MIKKTVKKTIKIIVGIVLVIIGLIGGLIPIFQGWIFGIPGLLLLSSVFPPLRKWVDKMKAKIKSRKKEN
jgi:uncharacterized membrane protein YbaN (DUF454 family)|tara:strand:+ start:195 stop:404 length:210 start_codon:yes stop_codon:yes gene_type:complete